MMLSVATVLRAVYRLEGARPRAARQQKGSNADFRAGNSRVQDAGSKLDLI